MARTLMEIADLILAHLTVKIQDAGENPADFCALTVYPGADVPADYALEDCTSMAYVRMTGANPTEGFPNMDITASTCAYSLAYGFEIGIMRQAVLPADLVGGGVELPTPEEQRAEADQQFKDLETMHKAIKGLKNDVAQLVMGIYTPVGPVGGVYGGFWTLTVGDD